MRKYHLPEYISILGNLKHENGILIDKKKKREFFINKTSLALINKILKVKKEDLRSEEQKFAKELINQGILQDSKDANSSTGVFRIVETDTPLNAIQFEISKRCNLRCVHCYLPNYSVKDDLPKERIFQLIEEAADLGVTSFDITGGEPFMHRNIIDVLYKIHSVGMQASVFTNGTILDDEILKCLKETYIKKLKISIDGFDATSHDKIRKIKGSYNKTISNIKRLKENDITVEINTVLHKGNYLHADKIIRDLDKLDIMYHIDRYVPYDGNVNDELCITDEEYLQAIKLVKENKLQSVIESTEYSSQHSEFFCGAGNSYVFLKASGEVAFCPTMPKNFSGGNILDENLEEIWLNSKFFNHIRNVNCKYYKECPVSGICRGGCRSRSQLLYGDVEKADLQMCKLMKELTGETPPPLVKN